MSPSNDQLMKDVIEWDACNWSKVLLFWTEALSRFPPEKTRVLCLGERNGGLSLWFALAGYQVVCSDFQGEMQAAQQLHKKYNVTDRVTYASVDIFHIPFEDNSFGIVACKSVIGGLKLVYGDKRTRTLENQKTAVNEVKRVLKRGGVFLGAENMSGSLLHRALRRWVKGRKIGWRHISTNEMKWLLSDYAETKIKFYGFLGTNSEKWSSLTCVLDRWLSPLLPNSWLYISFFVAKK